MFDDDDVLAQVLDQVELVAREQHGRAPRGPAPDWPRLAPATVIQAGDGQALLRVGRDTDVAALLAVIRDCAELVSFSYQPPTLSELFRQAVTA